MTANDANAPSLVQLAAALLPLALQCRIVQLTPPALRVEATEEQLAAVRARLEKVRMRVDGFDILFPTFGAAVDALPDLAPAEHVLFELRVVLLDALVDAGVLVPHAIWHYWGMGHLERLPEGCMVGS